VTKKRPANGKAQTHFEQVPLEVVKQISKGVSKKGTIEPDSTIGPASARGERRRVTQGLAEPSVAPLPSLTLKARRD
jgi:hypothetical protein